MYKYSSNNDIRLFVFYYVSGFQLLVKMKLGNTLNTVIRLIHLTDNIFFSRSKTLVTEGGRIKWLVN